MQQAAEAPRSGQAHTASGRIGSDTSWSETPFSRTAEQPSRLQPGWWSPAAPTAAVHLLLTSVGHIKILASSFFPPKLSPLPGSVPHLSLLPPLRIFLSSSSLMDASCLPHPLKIGKQVQKP